MEVNFHQLLEAWIRKFGEVANRHGLEVVAINDTLDVHIPEAVAIPAALITNELLTNSLRHAFEDKAGIQTVAVFLRESSDYNHWILAVKDSGTGLPLAIDPAIPTTAGMEIIEGFRRRLAAKRVVTREGGTQFHFEIPKPAA